MPNGLANCANVSIVNHCKATASQSTHAKNDGFTMGPTVSFWTEHRPASYLITSMRHLTFGGKFEN
jgi:hypothetical protein